MPQNVITSLQRSTLQIQVSLHIFQLKIFGTVDRSVPRAILDGSINIASKSNKSCSFTKWIIYLPFGLVVHKSAGFPVLLIVFVQQWSDFKKCSAQFWGQVVCLLVICSPRQAVSPLVMLQSDGLLSLFTDCTASHSVLSNSARFSCANSSESFPGEFISKDTFSMLIKWRGFETARSSDSLKTSM